MIKLSLNALEARKLAKSFGLIFEGTGRKWALRNLRSGKTMEQLGAVGKKHLSDVMPVAKRLGKSGREVGINIYKTRRSAIKRGGVGHIADTNISKKIVKTFHTHPFSGMDNSSLEDTIKSQLKSLGTSRKDMRDTLGAMKNKELSKFLKKMFKDPGTTPKGIFQANPSGADHLTSQLGGPGGDMRFINKMPNAHHNILATDLMILGVHKIRPKGLRTFYQKV